MKWSFSADKCFKRCQRQYLFREIAAWHNAKDPFRRSAFLRKQLKTMELWRGLVVHKGIELFVIPKLYGRQAINWREVADNTVDLARRQFAFSAAGRYLEKGVTKTAHEDEYCALMMHDEGTTILEVDADTVYESVRTAIENLSAMVGLIRRISGQRKYLAEIPFIVKYRGVNIDVQPDLLYFRAFGKPTIIDWKVYEEVGDSDAQLQTALYAWALCQHERWGVKRPEDVELVEVHLLEGKVIEHACSADLFDEIEDRIFQSVQEIKALRSDSKYDELDLADFAYAASPNSCKYCSFRPLCLEK